MRKFTKKQRIKIYTQSLKNFDKHPVYGLCLQLKHFGKISSSESYSLDKIFPELKMVAPLDWEGPISWFMGASHIPYSDNDYKKQIRLTLFALMIAITK